MVHHKYQSRIYVVVVYLFLLSHPLISILDFLGFLTQLEVEVLKLQEAMLSTVLLSKVLLFEEVQEAILSKELQVADILHLS